MANVKNVKEFDLNYNLPQVRSLEGDELFNEHDKLHQHFSQRTRITYNSLNKPTAEQVLKDLEEVDEVLIRLGDYLVIRVGQNNRLWINGTLYGYNASSTKDELVRPEEVWTYVSEDNKKAKVYGWFPPTTVRDLGTQWLKNKLETLLG